MTTHTTTTPDFQPLRPAGASETGAVFGFTVLANGDGKKGRLRFTISKAAHPKNWLATPDTHLRLDVCEKTKLGRLTAVDKDADEARKLHTIATTKRSLFSFPYSGKAADLFPQYAGVCELDVVETKEDEIIFKLPDLELLEISTQ